MATDMIETALASVLEELEDIKKKEEEQTKLLKGSNGGNGRNGKAVRRAKAGAVSAAQYSPIGGGNCKRYKQTTTNDRSAA